jgi:enamine deaminase RidA (YjgF/YER057c/UK114 family)
LKRAGASWDDIVEMTSYHTDLTSQIEPMAKVKARYIKAPYPAWSAIQVARLFPDRGITEIKLVLKLPKAK